MYAELVTTEASANCVTCSFASPNPGLSTRLIVHPGGALLANKGTHTLRIGMSGSLAP